MLLNYTTIPATMKHLEVLFGWHVSKFLPGTLAFISDFKYIRYTVLTMCNLWLNTLTVDCTYVITVK